jgi:predicted RNA-binding Zn-ribbon protein involved in translation (DUF1610 family)
LICAYTKSRFERQDGLGRTLTFKKTEQGKLSKEKFALLVAETEKRPVSVKDFRYLYSHYWHHECPSCKTIGAVAGDEDWEELADDQSNADYGYQIIERGYLPSEFHCPTCGLSLVGDPAVNAVGITEGVVEVAEEEITYEPDYGND